MSQDMASKASSTRPGDYQVYIDLMLEELEESRTIAQRKTIIWFFFAIASTAGGMIILFASLLLALTGVLVLTNFITTTTLSLPFVKNTPLAVASLVAGISFTFVGTLVYRQVGKTNRQIDNYYLGRIQEAKRLSRSIVFSSKIETDEKTKDPLNKLIVQRILDFLTQK